jgi:hypothetical protein
MRFRLGHPGGGEVFRRTVVGDSEGKNPNSEAAPAGTRSGCGDDARSASGRGCSAISSVSNSSKVAKMTQENRLLAVVAL